jgi:short-subunit dehydrogenase
MIKKSLNGKHVIITGASGGLGARLALDCASYGAVPVLLARRISQLEQVKQLVKEQTGIDCFIHELDVSDRDQVKEVLGIFFRRSLCRMFLLIMPASVCLKNLKMLHGAM